MSTVKKEKDAHVECTAVRNEQNRGETEKGGE